MIDQDLRQDLLGALNANAKLLNEPELRRLVSLAGAAVFKEVLVEDVAEVNYVPYLPKAIKKKPNGREKSVGPVICRGVRYESIKSCFQDYGINYKDHRGEYKKLYKAHKDGASLEDLLPELIDDEAKVEVAAEVEVEENIPPKTRPIEVVPQQRETPKVEAFMSKDKVVRRNRPQGGGRDSGRFHPF